MADQESTAAIYVPQAREHWVGADDPQLLLLRRWQTERLARTYADLRASRRYGPACDFFLSDIYSSTVFGEHLDDIKRVYGLMPKLLPARVVQTVSTAFELYELSEELDQALRQALVDELGMTDGLTAEMYAQGYRVCDNYEQRARQIDLIVETGQGVEYLTQLSRVAWTLRLTRKPAQLAGWGDIHDFLSRGYQAFKHMKGADFFLETIHEREMRILDRIFARHPDPFELPEI